MLNPEEYIDQPLTEVTERLQHLLQDYEKTHDYRATFTYTYLQLTLGLDQALRVGEPPFHDGPWVAALAGCLAEKYFEAMQAIDEWQDICSGPVARKISATDLPASVPEPWRAVYAASRTGHSYILEDLLFSMTAHISYDLPLALRQMAGKAPADQRIADFHTMNAVLGNMIDLIQDGLAVRYSRGLLDLDRLFTRQDELLTNYGIRVSRGMAWYNFERLSDEYAAPQAEHSIRTSTGMLIQSVRSPDDWRLRWALGLARWLIPERRQWPTDEFNKDKALGGS
jgi:hypothetical protein